MKITPVQTGIKAKAQWLLSLGCSPLPVAPAQAEPVGKNGKPLFNGKNPSYLDSSGKAHLIKHSDFNKAQPTDADLEKWFEHPANGIGTVAGTGGIDWIDLDRKNFDSDKDCDTARAQILELCDRTYYESTKSGGFHIAVRLGSKKDFTNFSLGGSGRHAGEFLGVGRFVVVAPTPGYSSLNGDEIASVENAEALGLQRVGSLQPETKPIETDLSPVPLANLLSKPCKEILKGKTDGDASASLAKLAREAYGVAQWYPEKGLPVTGDADDLLNKVAEMLGVDSKRLTNILKSIPTVGNRPALVEWGNEERAIAFFMKQQKANVDGEDVCKELQKIRSLRAEYGDRLRFNELSQKIEVDGVSLEDIEGERIYYIEKTNQSIGVDSFCSVLRVIAAENSYHPVALKLEAVSAEHGDDTSILENIAKRYFGVDDPLYDTYLKRWLISAVARIREPGCKADCALFLQGGQGARKSTFFSVLAGDDFFSDSLGDTQNNKDEILLMHRFWIHEWSELETIFRKKEMATVKSFMARRFDSVRPPYRRDLIDLKRRCVFAGTTNENAFLSDNTGDRRFWTIPVKGKIPTDLLLKERDRIWAAAVALYEQGEQWYLTEEEETASRMLNAQFRSLDPWHEKVESFLSSKQSTTINEVLTGCFEYELKAIGRKEQLRVSGVLTALGWKSSTQKEHGKTVRRWVPEFSPVELALADLQSIDTWEGYSNIAENYTKDALEKAWAQLATDHQNLIIALQPQPEPELVSEVQPEQKQPALEIDDFEDIDNLEDSQPVAFAKGQRVRYVGDRFPSLRCEDLQISDIKGDRITCAKPDGYLTTHLETSELEHANS